MKASVVGTFFMAGEALAEALKDAALEKYVTKFCDFFTKTTNRKPQAVGF